VVTVEKTESRWSPVGSRPARPPGNIQANYEARFTRARAGYLQALAGQHWPPGKGEQLLGDIESPKILSARAPQAAC